MRARTVSPRDAALTILHAWFGDAATKPVSTLRLTSFQQQAVSRLDRILTRRGGAILADAVGLGKTYVALSLVEAALRADQNVVLAIPAPLRRHWQQHLRKLPAALRGEPRLITHTALSFGRAPAVEPALVVVDEAHAFRNPHTRRYDVLSRMSGRARVLLLSATPINNTLDDLYHLIRLFAERSGFRDLGIADLRDTFRRAHIDPGAQRAVQQVIDALVVRRTRRVIADEPQATHTASLRFAERAPPRNIRYDLLAAYGPAWRDIYAALQQLTFAAAAGGSTVGPAELMRLQMLKRLESSVTAFALSMSRQAQLCDLMLDALQHGRWIEPAVLRGLIRDLDLGTQLPAHPLLARSLPRELDVHALETALCTDRQLFRRCETSLRAVASADPKLNALLDLLRELDAGVMVFTQYRDTAIYLWQRLQRTFRVGLVHGTDARLGARRAARTTVIECFAPRANGAQPPGDRLRVDVLIATDVLSEGLNLQDAHTVVSYDIPWNPVTLMQRLGRVDRLASPHARVQLCNFLPDRGLEDWLHLMERVEQKLLMIDRTIGGDGTLLERADSLQPGTVAGITGQRLLPDATLELQEQVELLRARWLRIGAFKPRRGPVVSSLPGHVEGWLIAVHDDTRVRLLFVDDLGNARDDVRAACQLLDAALDCPGIPSAPGAAVPWAQMQDWLGAERAAVALAPANRHNSEERRVTRLLLNAMDAAAPNPRLARRAERLLNLLASPSQPTCRDRLPALLACCGPAPDAAELITSLEDLYARAREPVRARERLRLIAAIQVVR